MKSNWRTRTALWVLAAAALVAAPQLGAPTPAAGQGRNAEERGAGQPAAQLEIVPVQGHIYMLVGKNSPNIVLQIGDEGALVVDPGPAELTPQVLAAIKSLNKSGRPIQYIIDTQFTPDHTGGNGVIAKSGWRTADPNDVTPILAHENALKRMSAPTGERAPRESGEWPTDVFGNVSKELFFNGESIQLLHEPAAHTDGDTIVYFRHSDVIAAGDVFVTTTYPVIDTQAGGTVNGVIAGLNHILQIAIPAAKQEDGTLIVPGHGRLCDEADVASYRDMVTIVRDRVEDAVKKGMTLDQVKASTVSLEYDVRYGMKPGPGSRDAFLEAVYKTVPRGGRAPSSR